MVLLDFVLLGHELDKIFLEIFGLVHCLALVSILLQRAS